MYQKCQAHSQHSLPKGFPSKQEASTAFWHQKNTKYTTNQFIVEIHSRWSPTRLTFPWISSAFQPGLRWPSVFNTGSPFTNAKTIKKDQLLWSPQNKAQHADNETLHHSHALRQCCLHTTGQNRLKLPNKKNRQRLLCRLSKGGLSQQSWHFLFSDKKNIYKEGDVKPPDPKDQLENWYSGTEVTRLSPGRKPMLKRNVISNEAADPKQTAIWLLYSTSNVRILFMAPPCHECDQNLSILSLVSTIVVKLSFHFRPKKPLHTCWMPRKHATAMHTPNGI